MLSRHVISPASNEHPSFATTVTAMDLGIAGRRAAVAGASGGLGLATAKALAADGVMVAICGRDEARITAAAADVGHGCIPLVCDVSSLEGGERFVELATAALGGIDILIANAGGPPPGNFASTPTDLYQTGLDLNLLSVVGMCKAAVPAMQARHWGRVVAITSVAVRQPIPGLILSNTARAGVTGFLKTVAREVAVDGVTVNTVQPGIHATNRMTQLYGGTPDGAALGIPAGIVGDPDDFGHVVAFLCSDQAKFVTGAQLQVDGGAYGGLL
ncbi:MAG: short-chain dehydrogenase/reductase [Ilumatobacteraceae bacterium]|nr:short-chain dehydrogenase/reductase [Ilumatobacteraceae bacterium]